MCYIKQILISYWNNNCFLLRVFLLKGIPWRMSNVHYYFVKKIELVHISENFKSKKIIMPNTLKVVNKYKCEASLTRSVIHVIKNKRVNNI